MRDVEKINDLKDDVNVAKERLMSIADELRDAGGIREASSLETLIWKLEIWQNK